MTIDIAVQGGDGIGIKAIVKVSAKPFLRRQDDANTSVNAQESY